MGIPSDCLRIGDFARLGGTNLRTLRYYEQLGLMTPTARSDGGFRYFRRSDLNRLGMIRELQSLGMDLSGIGKLMDTRCAPKDSSEMLARVRRALLERQRLIEEQVAHLNQERLNVSQALNKLNECLHCEHKPTAENNYCEPCVKSGLSVPNDLSALY
ncbi:MAG: DNA-binding transcriptional MerR regulator [Planctomycetota bacterium]|jgi:DNA-binding transcriptional MerR regulator